LGSGVKYLDDKGRTEMDFARLSEDDIGRLN